VIEINDDVFLSVADYDEETALFLLQICETCFLELIRGRIPELHSELELEYGSLYGQL